MYITKDGWEPRLTKPLTWADMEIVSFSTVTDPPSVGNPGSIDSYYYWARLASMTRKPDHRHAGSLPSRSNRQDG